MPRRVRLSNLPDMAGEQMIRVGNVSVPLDTAVAWVAEYFLAPEIIAHAMAAGAGVWCAKVRAARRARRTQAAQARRNAERANASRSARRSHPGQQGLFD